MPGPATLEILAAASAPLIPPPTGVRAELVTPTGAALLCSLATFAQPPMVLRAVGHGAGKADFPHPNILRVWLGSSTSSSLDLESGSIDDLALLETNIDDMSPQVHGYLFERLLDAGALDVYCTAILMKKNRPGTMLSVLCHNVDAARFQDLLLRETTTMGVRVQPVRRARAGRSTSAVETPLGPVRVKVKWLAGRPVAAAPEYEDCLALARRHNRPLIEVLALARRSAEEQVKAEVGSRQGGTA